MSRSSKPFFLFAFSLACVAFIASGSFFTEASDKKGPSKKVLPGALATSLLTDDFSYTASTAVTANGWTGHSSAGTNAIQVTSPGLSYAGYAGSGVGNAVTLNTSGEDASRQFTAVTSGSVYAAVMVNVTSTQTAGDYFFHLMNFGTTTFRGRVFARKDASTTNFAFGVSRSSGTPEYTANSFVPGTTYLLVVKYTYVDGAANDVVQLFVNPTPGGAEPMATLTATDADNTEPAQLSGVGIRQGSSSNAAVVQVDGIRVATTWAEAVATSGGPTPTPTPTPQKANVDMNGDGRSDFLITREGTGFTANAPERYTPRSMRERMMAKPGTGESTAPEGANPAEWWGVNNGAPGGTNVNWGQTNTDFLISADFDGDELDDVAIWRPGPPDTAAFYSINSSDLTYRVQAFGQDGDNPTIVGDYDGDGKDDSATFRCPPFGSGADQCYFFYRASSNNPTNGITYIPWGYGESFDFFPYPGDFDGDGKHDFCLQAINPDAPQQAIFLLQNNDATYSQEYIHWGYSNDFLIPGDFDGDGKSDFAVMRIESGRLVFYIQHRTGTVRAAQWGLASDFPVPGDYDGDGKQDIAVYRWNSTNATYWILPSNGDPHWAFEFGIPGDVPVANWYVQ